jgi:hypothetical protein
MLMVHNKNPREFPDIKGKENDQVRIFIYLFTRRCRPGYLFSTLSRSRYLFAKKLPILHIK